MLLRCETSWPHAAALRSFHRPLEGRSHSPGTRRPDCRVVVCVLAPEEFAGQARARVRREARGGSRDFLKRPSVIALTFRVEIFLLLVVLPLFVFSRVLLSHCPCSLNSAGFSYIALQNRPSRLTMFRISPPLLRRVRFPCPSQCIPVTSTRFRSRVATTRGAISHLIVPPLPHRPLPLSGRRHLASTTETSFGFFAAQEFHANDAGSAGALWLVERACLRPLGSAWYLSGVLDDRHLKPGVGAKKAFIDAL